ncbi:MAG: hypothetical protein RBT65_10130 [Methanolobus sp.]|jgi:hypothetical protein|nr:hypothetical protein [Methanolobus sp.]
MGEDKKFTNDQLAGLLQLLGSGAGAIGQGMGGEGGGGSIGMSMLSGGMSGAAAGTAVLPGIGTAIGGGIGLLTGWLGANSKQKAYRRAEEKRKANEAFAERQHQGLQQQQIDQDFNVLGNNSTGFYKKGGMLNPTAKVEGGEVYMGNNKPLKTDSRGTTKKIANGLQTISGDAHSAPSGGIGVATDRPGLIFSDTLKLRPETYKLFKTLFK